MSEAVYDLLRGDGSELELLAAREDGFGNLVRVRRRHDEERAGRRLFKRLQKRVKGGRGKHVDFINDKDPVAVAGGGFVDCFDNHVAHVVNARVRCGVNFEHVHRATLGDLAARCARVRVGRAAGRGRRAVRAMAVDGLRQKPCGRSLADAARARKQVSVMKAFVLDGVSERARDVLLPRDLLEGLRSPLARDDLVGHKKRSAISRQLLSTTPPVVVFSINSMRLPNGSKKEKRVMPGSAGSSLVRTPLRSR